MDARGETIARAKRLRREMSLPEVKLWQVLRARPDGWKWRHQHPVEPYILDFYCARLKLAVEIDGGSHDHPDQFRHDLRRDAHLRSLGIEVVRYAASAYWTTLKASPSASLKSAGRAAPSTMLRMVPLPPWGRMFGSACARRFPVSP